MMRLVAASIVGMSMLSVGVPMAAAGSLPVASAFNPVSVDAHKTRIFLPLKNVRITKRQSTVTAWQMELKSDSSSLYTLERAIGRGALHHVRIQSFEGKTYIRADWRYAAKVSVDVRSGGLEIFFYNQKAAPHFRTVASGVRYWEGQRWSGAGPMRVRVLKLDPDQVRLQPVIATSGNKMGLGTVSHLAQRAGAIAAVNGGFFSPRTGEPQGTLVLNHNLVSRAMLNRPSLLIKQDGSASIKAAKPAASVKLEDGTVIAVNGVNERPKHNRITLYTAHYGRTTRTIADPSRWEYAVNQSGQIVAEGNGALAIPAGGYVLSGQGKSYFDLRKWMGLGQEIKVGFGLDPAVTHAVGGGPVIMQKGRVRIVTASQHFQPDVVRSRAARTAVGLTKDGGYMLVTVDGNRPGYSVGATLNELATTMKEFGAVEALNLDGGGSTTFWMQGHVANRPSDGRERPVSNALLVLPKDREIASALYGMLATNLAY